MTNPQLNAWIDEHVFGRVGTTGIPDYCGDWAAFGKLVEWCHRSGLRPSHSTITPGWHAWLSRDGHLFAKTSPTLPLALARAVYEALKE